MAEPQYPTKDGLWSKGQRKEPKSSGVRLETPYRKPVDSFRRASQDRDDFDPAVLFVWGTMQAKAVLGILKAVEEVFGEQGQEVARRAINKVGYEAAREMFENSTWPDDADEVELLSYIVTGINTVLYASLEKPWITSNDRCEFDILWCPHQDVYTAFDCRVQRYFVEGMIEAVQDQGLTRFLPAVDKLIPRGGDCCHFTVDRLTEDGGKHPWHAYSDDLARRALDKLGEEK